MFINKSPSGRNNICGVAIKQFRTELKISQRELADRLPAEQFCEWVKDQGIKAISING